MYTMIPRHFSKQKVCLLPIDIHHFQTSPVFAPRFRSTAHYSLQCTLNGIFLKIGIISEYEIDHKMVLFARSGMHHLKWHVSFTLVIKPHSARLSAHVQSA
jgi:hypothetical protein